MSDETRPLGPAQGAGQRTGTGGTGTGGTGTGGTGSGGTGSGGRVLAGRYELEDLLGRGGMAVVHRARDLRLGRQVAVKMLRPDLARDPAFQARFRREAQSSAGLNHPSIVAVYDTGEAELAPEPGGHAETVPFIVMEYVPGRTVRELLHSGEREDDGAPTTVAPAAEQVPSPGGRGPVTPSHPSPLGVEQAVRIVMGVLSALAYSHRGGIVHRDIKPANVMLTASGGVKVMDFGIARALSDAAATMTQTQAVIGTAQYLSPEQARGEQVDARSDLYSAGCLLYELLTGRPPFVGDSPVAVAYQHVREEPQAPSTFNPAVPPALDAVVLHALRKDREDRYVDADAFRAELQDVLAGRPVQAATAATTSMPVTDDAVTRPVARVAPAAVPPLSIDDLRAEQEEPAWDEPPARRGRAAGWVALALTLLVLAGLGAFLATQVLGGPDDPVEVAVPAVVDLPREQAKAAVEQAGLVYAEGPPVSSDTVPEGDVVSQDPAGDTTVEDGATVTVVVSLGVGEVAVPDLAGLSQQDARQALAELGLRVGDVSSEDSPDVPADAVLRTSPEVGQNVAEGSEVALVVSTGEVTVPNLAGQDYTAARATLANDLGLSSQVVFEERADVAADTVIRQEPGPGSVAQRSEVVLYVAQAPAPTPTETPTPEPTATPTVTPTDPPGDGDPPPDPDPTPTG